MTVGVVVKGAPIPIHFHRPLRTSMVGSWNEGNNTDDCRTTLRSYRYVCTCGLRSLVRSSPGTEYRARDSLNNYIATMPET